MKLGILMAGGYGLLPATDGRKVQIQKQADALEQIGHQVIRLNPWDSYPVASLDAVHLVEGGFGNIPGAFGPIPDVAKMGIAPFLDTPRASWIYRLIAFAGSRHSRFMTYQGALRLQAKVCDVLVVRNKDESRLLTKGIGIPAQKVKLVLNGVDPPKPVHPHKVRDHFRIHSDFVFHVSTFTQPRKNIIRLIEAIGPLNLPLIIAGTAGTPAQSNLVYQAAKKYPQIRFIGKLTEEQRDALYAACKVFCLPSLYEGTGLVALEAASYGANIVITRMGGPPDYFETMADYVDPFSVISIRQAIENAWSRPRDQKLREHVLANLTWLSSARNLAAAYGCQPDANITPPTASELAS